MSTLHVEVGHKVIVSGDPMTHVVIWTNHRAFDSACGLVIEDYQPDYYQSLLEVGDTPLLPREHPGYHDPDDENYSTRHPALQLQRAPDDAPITCLQCLRKLWRLGDMGLDEVEEDEGTRWDTCVE